MYCHRLFYAVGTARVQEDSRPKTHRAEPTVTPDEAHDHFRRALAGSAWAVLRGWHVLRHRIASNCTAAGVGQLVISEWMGQQTALRRNCCARFCAMGVHPPYPRCHEPSQPGLPLTLPSPPPEGERVG